MRDQTKPLIRQGDILFVPLTHNSNMFTGAQRSARTKHKNGVIALGEATGHHHQVEPGTDPALFDHFELDGERYLEVLEKSLTVVHEEHGPQNLPPGQYAIKQAREFDYAQNVRRYVED